MQKTVRQLISLLDTHERRRLCLVLGMIVVMGLLDMASVAAIGPFLQVLANPETSGSWPIETAREVLAPETTIGLLTWLAGFALVLLLMSLAFKALTIYAMTRFSFMRAFGLSRRLMDGYLRQPYTWFLNRHSSDLGKSVLSEVDNAVRAALMPALRAVAQSVVVIALVTLLVITNPMAAILGFAFVVVSYGLVFLCLRKRLDRIGEERLQANADRYRFSQEALRGIKEIKLRRLEPVYIRRFSGPAFRFADRQASALLISILPRFLLEAIVFGGMLALVLGLLVASDSRLDAVIPTIGVFAMAGARLFPALQQVYAGVSQLRFNAPAVQALYDDMVTQARQHDPDAGPGDDADGPAMAFRRKLSVRDVVLSYPEADRPALNHLNLEVMANTSVGIVGSTGAGKTTLVDLILGLLRPDQGRVEVDGVELTGENLPAWQRSVGYVPQQIFLIDESVAENIALGVPPEQIDMAAVERAARIAELHDYVVTQLPEGYATKLGESGVRLSGGQRQRVGIARALYHDPAVLVLDEATSALDNLTEHAVMDAVNTVARAQTTIIIAHRLSTVKACDKIVMLHQGRVVSEGTYDDLMSDNREFQRMVMAAS